MASQKYRRILTIVIDSIGVGDAPDADKYKSNGADTLGHMAQWWVDNQGRPLALPNMERLGLGRVRPGKPFAGVSADTEPAGGFGRMRIISLGNDSLDGHWEMMCLPTRFEVDYFPQGFPDELLDKLRAFSGRNIVCNKPYSGTQVLKDYGEQAMKEDALIVYTSADSVFQVAANEELVPVHELYRYCEIAREMLKGEYGVGRVIARPFLGHTADTFYRTTNRHDLSLKPPRKTMLDLLKDAGRDVIAVGKIFDIFDGEGVTEKIKTTGNTNGIAFTKALQTRDFEGLAFVNLVDFDMLYGHRRDVAGYAAAATEFDKFVADFIPGMREGDILMVTADHGCDPSYTKTTDHTREYVPYLICGKGVKPGVDLGTKLCFGTIAQTICDYLGVDASTLDGQSVLGDILA